MIKLFAKLSANLKNFKAAKAALFGAGVFLIVYFLQINLVIALFLVALYAYFKKRCLNIRSCNALNLVFLFLLIFTLCYFILKERWPIFFLPFSFLPLLVTLLFSSLELSLILNLALAISLAAYSANPFALFLFFLFGAVFASIFTFGARRRTTVIRAGLFTGILQAAALVFLEHFWIGQPLRYLILAVNSLACSVIVLGALPIFEYLFNNITNISLLELADFHHPLLQRMIMEAPGTYHHSLVVGNLSESACRAVGANALLARIGAYYHDIGKLSKPGYFSENQEVSESKHDNLTPTISKMIIMNHVKEGVELAKKYKLGAALQDFIQEHHGKSLVYYFYRRALEALEEDHEVKEEGFRYPGPKPNTKETAVVLLADSVEAATRALKDPSPAKVEELVHKVINNKFIDGQLDECDLTLKDLEKISAVFIRILSGIYHSRISYPEERNGQNLNKKPAKENPHQSQKDKKSNP
ncbi:MAG: HDIG domain-containing metalloprotein [Candidatus Omnitrophota bacterium]